MDLSERTVRQVGPAPDRTAFHINVASCLRGTRGRGPASEASPCALAARRPHPSPCIRRSTSTSSRTRAWQGPHLPFFRKAEPPHEADGRRHPLRRAVGRDTRPSRPFPQAAATATWTRG